MDPELAAAIEARYARMDSERVLERLWEHDHTIWANDPSEITNRLGWLRIHDRTLAEAAELTRFAHETLSEGFTSVVLMGMGGSSLAPEVFATSFGTRGARLFVLDSTDPRQLAATERELDLGRTLFVVSSKSGGTIETRSQLEYFWAKVSNGSQFVAITDPGRELAAIGEQRGFRRVFLNDPDIGGRYSALSYFGMVPAALCGIDIAALLRGADEMASRCAPGVPPRQNPGAQLGVFMGEAALAERDKLTLVLPDPIETLGHWIEQLVAESTGKHARGVIPVERESLGDLREYGNDRAFVVNGAEPSLADLEQAGHPVLQLPDVAPEALGAEMFRWMFATAVAGYVLGLNPFDQPNVEEAKRATAAVLKGSPTVSTTPPLIEVLSTIKSGDYLAILAYLPRNSQTTRRLELARHALRARYCVATTVGFGPRYLHSTGQLHKGGPNTGVFIQVVDPATEDIAIPGAPYTFGELEAAQALGDLAALKHHGRRAARVTLDELETAVLAVRD